MSDPSESQPAAAKRKPRRKFGIGAILLGVPIILWIGAAFFVARSLMYPEFLRRGGQDVFGQHVPSFQRGSVTDIGAALGVEPERLDCGVVEEDGYPASPGQRGGMVFSRQAARSGGDRARGGSAGNGDDSVRQVSARRRLHRGRECTAPTIPTYGINWGMLKRKFALATARTLKDDGFHQDRRAGNLRRRRRRNHGAGRAAGLHRDRRRQFLRESRATVHAQPVDVAAESGVRQHGNVGSAALVRPHAGQNLAGRRTRATSALARC